jgi:hypothetical protein
MSAEFVPVTVPDIRVYCGALGDAHRAAFRKI